MAIVSGLEFGSCFQGDCFVLWAAAPRAPISHVADARGLAVLWGDAISGPGPERVDALTLRSRWQAREGDSPQPYDGFYAAVVFDFEQGLTVGADLLGLFPVYYCTAGDTLLIGSSPEMFRHHPAFQLELNPVGLVGILLTNGLLNGQTLSKGVQRLSPGHLLVWRPGKSPRELRQYEIPLSTRYSGLPLQAHVEILDDAIRDAMKRHVPRGEGCGFLLSGGLDSRLLGGYLAETGIEVHALTWGLPSDIEMQCAIAVARTLRLPHRRFEPSPEAYVTGAKLQANYEQLANGFNQIRLWDIVPRLADLGTRSVTGLMLDRVITPHTNYESPPSGDPLECALALQNELGIPPEVLRTCCEAMFSAILFQRSSLSFGESMWSPPLQTFGVRGVSNLGIERAFTWEVPRTAFRLVVGRCWSRLIGRCSMPRRVSQQQVWRTAWQNGNYSAIGFPSSRRFLWIEDRLTRCLLGRKCTICSRGFCGGD